MTEMVDTKLPAPGFRVRLADNLARRIALGPRRKLNRPLVSFTFDDVPVSAAIEGTALLEEFGARGTYYVAGSFIGISTEHYQVVSGDDIVRLHANGHEIGCHSFSHGRTDYVGANALVSDVLRNRAALKAIEPSLPLRNFAYPYGFASLGWKSKLRCLFDSCRTVYPRVHTGEIDPQYLLALPLIQAETDGDAIERALDQAQQNNGWTIFYTHDVAAKPSPYGCTPSLLKHALAAVTRKGIAIATIQQGVEQFAPSAASAMTLAPGAA